MSYGVPHVRQSFPWPATLSLQLQPATIGLSARAMTLVGSSAQRRRLE